MSSLLENLVLYEVILLFLGIFLFLILSGGLVYYIIKKEEIKKLLAFFIVPIIMIAYPSIREIQFGETKIVMYDKIEEVLKNPNDSTALAELKTVTTQIENRAKTVKDITAVSNSYYILGDHEKAIYYANKAQKLNEKNNKLPFVKVNAEKIPKKDSDNNKIDKKDELNKGITKKNKTKLAKYKFNATQIQNIKTMVKIEKAIKKDPTLLKDSLRLNQQLMQVKKINNPVKYNYFTKKYLNKATVNKATIIKNNH